MFLLDWFPYNGIKILSNIYKIVTGFWIKSILLQLILYPVLISQISTSEVMFW